MWFGALLLVSSLCQQARAADQSSEAAVTSEVSARAHRVVGTSLLAASIPIRVAGIMTIWMTAIGDCVRCGQQVDPLYFVGGGLMTIGQAAASIGWGHAIQGAHVARSHEAGNSTCSKKGTGAVVIGVGLVSAGIVGLGVGYAIKERDSIDSAIAPIFASTAAVSIGSNVLGVGLVRRKYHKDTESHVVSLHPQFNFSANRVGLLAQVRL